MLEAGRRAVYTAARAEQIPAEFRTRYLMRSRDTRQARVRIVPELRERVHFHRINLVEPFRLEQPVPIIFCRNVIIYFERPTQEALLQRLCAHLVDGGYLFMGHSETLNGMALPLEPVGPMIYRKTT